MGERYQVHVIMDTKKNVGGPVLVSTHIQWCWGQHIIRNMYRLMNTLRRSCGLDSYYGYLEECQDYIKGILTVNRSLNNKFYSYRVHTGTGFNTFEGDSNHGWAVLKVTLHKETCTVKSCFYDADGQPVSKKQLWKDCKYEFEYNGTDKEDIAKLKKMHNSLLFCNTDSDLQSEFNLLVVEQDKRLKAEEEDRKKHGCTVS